MSDHLPTNGILTDTMPSEQQQEASKNSIKEQEKVDGQSEPEVAIGGDQTLVNSEDQPQECCGDSDAPNKVDPSEEKMEVSTNESANGTPSKATLSPEPIEEPEPMETNEIEEEGEDFDDVGEESGVKSSSVRPKSKIHSRNITYPSIIRTRRSSGMAKQQQEGKKQTNVAGSVSKESKDDQQLVTQQSPATQQSPGTIMEDPGGEESIDGKEKRAVRGRNRAGGVGLKRHKSLEKESEELAGSSKSLTGRSGKSALVTRAAAAGKKGGIHFHQLPRRPKRQKTREDDECEEDEDQELPVSKKNKMEQENLEETSVESEDKGAEQSDQSSTGKGVAKSSPKGKAGRGSRGRRGKGGKAGDDEESTKKPKEEINEESEDTADKVSIDEQDGVGKQVPTKKKRGRPKKKGKEATTPTPSMAGTPTSEQKEEKEDVSISGEDLDASNSQEMTEPAAINTSQVNELSEMSEDTVTATTSGKESGIDNSGNEEKKQDNKPKDNEVQEEDKPKDDEVKEGSDAKDDKPKDSKEGLKDGGVDGVSKDSEPKEDDPKDGKANDSEPIKEGSKDDVSNNSRPPSAVEPTYPFGPTPRFSPLDEQNFHHAFPMPHPFIPGYPPFSNPPYPFMLPTSPHFPQPPFPAECVPPELYPRFAEEFARYPVQSIPTCSTPSASNTTTTSQVTESTASSVTSTSTPSSTPSSSHASCMAMPLPLSQGYPVYTLPSPYGPPPIIGTGMPPLPPTEWNLGPPPQPQGTPHQPPPPLAPPTLPATTTPTPAVSTSKPSKETKFPLHLISSEDSTTSVSQPVDCPECGRHFKNNKALNGHMRLHGGFDWTRRPYQVMQSRQQQQLLARESAEKKALAKESAASTGTTNTSTTATTKGGSSSKHASNRQQLIKNGINKGSSQSSSSTTSSATYPQTTTDTTRHQTGTLDDLCRAAEELERIERNGFKNKPTPLVLPHERRLQSFSPPYTPPPILSPARSLMLLSSSAERLASSTSNLNTSVVSTSSVGETNNTENVSTPSKIWPQRKVSDQRVTEPEDLLEPKINIGPDFQAELPPCKDFEGASPDGGNNDKGESGKASLVWAPLNGLLQEDEDTIDGFLELACSPAVPHGGRNKELGLHILHQVKGSVKEAVRMMVMGKTMVAPDNNMANYNYSGSKRWTSKERQQFRRAWRVHRKQFHQIQNHLESKSMPDLIEYYYSWKKYCSDEYRGRNRHHSEEAFSEEDGDIYVHPSSVTSTSSGSNEADNPLPPQQPPTNRETPVSEANQPAVPTSKHTRQQQQPTPVVSVHQTSTATSLPEKKIPTPSKNKMKAPSMEMMENLPRGLVPSPIGAPPLISSSYGAPVQEYRCKYPGCNQVYTSIFALNGHIRVHGGSWYPKKPDVENMQSSSSSKDTSSSSSSSNSTTSTLSKLKKEKEEEEKIRHHQLEIAKTMVMDLPQPRSPAQTMVTNVPSPRPSPSHGKSSLIKSKKVSSASPSDREGHYPCNRCGRIFPKVKSRSAHMKSHIVKPVKH